MTKGIDYVINESRGGPSVFSSLSGESLFGEKIPGLYPTAIAVDVDKLLEYLESEVAQGYADGKEALQKLLEDSQEAEARLVAQLEALEDELEDLRNG